MITTVILYVVLCVTPDQCSAYEPSTWTATSQEELTQVYAQCAAEERQWMKEDGYSESDCYEG